MIISFLHLVLGIYILSLSFLFIYFFRDKSVFTFFPDHEPVGFEEVLSRYKFITPGVQLSGPTSFVPLIEKTIEITSKNRSVFIEILM
jgi:hypothetical protein